jgi:hypothetical protein
VPVLAQGAVAVELQERVVEPRAQIVLQSLARFPFPNERYCYSALEKKARWADKLALH